MQFLGEALIWAAEDLWALILHITGRSSFPKPLCAAEEAEYIRRMGEGDASARDALIEHDLRLVAHIAKKYQGGALDADDLVSIGAIGLIKAVDTFRPEAGRLSAYASRCIENEMLMHLRANRKNHNVMLFGDSVGTDKDGNERTLDDLIGTDPNLVADEVETAIESRRALELIDEALEPREAMVVRMRCGLIDGEPQPQHAVAKALGISRSYVSRIEKRALAKLRARLEPPEA